MTEQAPQVRRGRLLTPWAVSALGVEPILNRGDTAPQRDANVTPKTPAQRSREYRERERQRKRDALTEALVTPATVTPVTPDITPQPVMPAVGLTKSERDDLVKITRERGRVAKSRVEAVKAELVADVEKKLSEEFKARDEMWRDGIEIAEQAVREANAQIQRVCEERGVPADFRPSVDLAWRSRGRNADPSRRAELRRLATARVDATGKQAKLTIEAEIAETVTKSARRRADIGSGTGTPGQDAGPAVADAAD